MNKKVWLLVFMFMLVIDVKALSFKGGDVIKNVFVLKVKENGEKEYKKGQFIIDSEGDYVYCLEPFVKVNNNSSYNKYTNNFAKYLGLSDELWEKINLISYYGYQYKDDTHNHMDPKWYYITQMLIWQNVSPKARFYFTDTFKGNVNSTLFVNEIKEIYNLVNNHYKIPEFDVPDTYIGDTLSIIDRNGVLKKFAGSKNVKINGNILTIKISDLSNKFTLKKGTNNKAFIFVSSDSQNVLKGKMDVPVIANYDIKGLELKGNIKIKKYGEAIDGDKISLEGVIFALFDENKNYIKEATTDKDGHIIFDNLKKGKYFIKEVSNNKKFVLDDNYYEANLRVNENNRIIDIFLELENKLKKGKLVIRKLDSSNGNVISNVEFVIMRDNEVIYEGVTNEYGEIEIDNLPLGIYIVKEVRASNGYILNEDEIEVSLDSEVKYIEIFNIPDTEVRMVDIIMFFEEKKKFLV